MMRKLVAILKCFLYFGIFFVVQIGVSILAFVLYMLKAIGSGEKNVLSQEKINALMESPQFSIVILLINAVICVIIFSIWYYFLHGRSEKKAYTVAMKRYISVKNILLTFAFAIVVQVALSMMLNMVFMLFPSWFAEYAELMKNLQTEISIFTILYVVIVGPVMEEYLFRGMIFRELRNKFSYWPAVLLSALFFAIYHMNLIQGIYTFFVGILFAMIYERYQTLLATIVLHMVFNLSSYVIDSIFPESLSVNILIMVLILVVSVGLFAIVFKKIMNVPVASKD